MNHPNVEIFSYSNSPRVIVVVKMGDGVNHFIQEDGTLGRNRFRFRNESEARKAIKAWYDK